MRTFILLLTFTLLFASCGRKEKKSKVTLRLSSGALVNGVAQTSGLIVMGKHRMFDQSFTLDGNASDGMVIELEKGNWDFYAIGWEGTPALQAAGVTRFAGNVRCNFQTKLLEANEEQVAFDMSTAQCTQKLPMPHDFYPHDPTISASIPTITIASCQDIITLGTPTAGDECANGANYGLGRSFLVKTYFHIGPENGGGQPMGHMESHCLTPDVNSNLSLPLGDTLKDDGLPGFHIFSFTEAGCQGQFIEYKFNGLAAGPQHPEQDSNLTMIGGQAYLFLEHNSQTPTDNGGHQNFFFGSGKDGNQNSSTAFSTVREERVIGIDNTGTVLTVPSSMATWFQPGDEIMWYVNECAGTGCNSGFKPGRFNFAHVKSNNGNNQITLHKPIHQETHYGTLTLPQNSDLSVTLSGPPTNYLSMQIVRVFNFDNLNVDGDIIANNYAPGIGNGGILAFKVKNEMSIDVTGTYRYIKATGAGRDNNTSVDMSGCGQGIPCLIMGGNNGVNASEKGGGIIFISARTLKYSRNASNVLQIKADGNIATTSSATKGGTLIAQFGEVIFNDKGYAMSADFTATQFQADGKTSGDPNPWGGYAKFEYCFETDAFAPGGSVPSPVTQSGATGAVEVNPNPDYCGFY